MPLSNLEELRPEASAVARTYVSAITAALSGTDHELVQETVSDVTHHLLDALDADATASDVEALVTALGEPVSYRESMRSGSSADGGTLHDSGRGAGTLLGIPYDVRMPTPERVASRLWDPRDPRILMPRVFGAGWTINFGGLAVRLHLIEPDSEDEPFGQVPDAAFMWALLVPVGLCAAILGSFLAFRAVLPAELPAHWNAAGVADDFWPAPTAFGMVFTLAAIPTAWAVWSVAKRRHPFGRGAVIGAASFLSAVAAGVWLLTLLTVQGVGASWWLPVACILAAFPVPLIVLVSLSRVGRLAEQRRDLSVQGGGEDREQ